VLTLRTLLIAVAVVLFVLAAFRVRGAPDWQPLGFAFIAASLIA
jgi:hypothetical protein